MSEIRTMKTCPKAGHIWFRTHFVQFMSEIPTSEIWTFVSLVFRHKILYHATWDTKILSIYISFYLSSIYLAMLLNKYNYCMCITFQRSSISYYFKIQKTGLKTSLYRNLEIGLKPILFFFPACHVASRKSSSPSSSIERRVQSRSWPKQLEPGSPHQPGDR